ncbi:MAG: IS3 family transposase [Myxococcaceae bacterium]|nr:IS3 family transposase [Myxococcaceae bacterium]
MSRATSPSANKPYGLARVCRVWGVSRATVYRRASAASEASPVRGRRGPKTRWSDEELLARIREDLSTSEWVSEGHRKVWARLRARGVRTSMRRVLRLMREADLLAPNRPRRELGPRVHDGTLITERPNQMWGTDATTTLTLEEGQATVFIAVDHCTAECVGIHAAKVGTRFEALEPIRQAVKARYGAYAEAIATGLVLRHDNGPQYVSDAFQRELDFLGIESSPSFVRSPEGNGCSERLIRTLKEQLLWLRPFKTVEELRLALHDWKDRYNRSWLIERHGFLTPDQARRRHEEQKLVA